MEEMRNEEMVYGKTMEPAAIEFAQEAPVEVTSEPVVNAGFSKAELGIVFVAGTLVGTLVAEVVIPAAVDFAGGLVKKHKEKAKAKKDLKNGIVNGTIVSEEDIDDEETAE